MVGPTRHGDHDERDGLNSASQVAEAIKAIFPNGVGQTPEPEVIRAIFLYLKRQDGGDSVQR